ncbi:replication factor C subunit 3 [Benincasa hispida]|uniref:replication factor C subunit 3 n=1 Tax=Benincasa hispida TaxID=102211 RepID=UPI00190139CE|nr:replication factor C subunit 3 [Benincasa hispida]
MALIRQMFGASAEKVKVEKQNVEVDVSFGCLSPFVEAVFWLFISIFSSSLSLSICTPFLFCFSSQAGTRTIDIELTTLSSTNHVELTPSDAGFQDRYIVQEIIKEMAKNRPIDSKGKKGHKVLVLNDVDKLSREAQHSLRRTMEKYSSYCRLILCCNSSSRVTEAIRSRCLNVRINGPTEEQIVKVLEFIGKKEGLQLPSGFASRIAEKSNRSLRRAILSFETCRVQQYPFVSNQAIPPMDWEEYITEIASDILKEQSPKRLFQVRGKLYELLVNCIPPEIILKRLLYELLKKLDAELKHEICHWAAYYEHRMRLGQKAIFHIEGKCIIYT